ncbi:sensory box/GGDEF family protein [Vibrio ishigakensis]|uniref:Sensory box/GGDEF family protein n=1 Tax=Vibrio ishigakensis TaxID=1481914 RepID=A0A0B8NTM7_9VIBR|nr:sensory box/GGDEF family protein [Vibrio ishigakensis]
MFESGYTQDILQDISTLSDHIEEMKNNLDLLATAAVYQSDEYPDYYVVRSPIYSGTVGNRTYLGHVTLLVDLEQMLQDSHFNDRQFLVAAVNEAKPSQRVGNLKAIDSAMIKTDINASNVDWQVFIAPDPNSNLPRWPLFNSVRLVGYVLLAMVFCGFAIILRLYFKARQRSMQDELTSLPNRRYFVYTLKNLVRNAKYTRTQFAVINLDLDGFKRINDEYGHSSGDLLLKQVARVLRGAVRATDVVARVGGDEFLIIASRIAQESEVTKLVEGIQHKVESENYLVRGAMVKTQVSIGFSMYKDKQTTFDNLLSSADINMYKNKALKRKLKGLRQEEKDAVNALENHD